MRLSESHFFRGIKKKKSLAFYKAMPLAQDPKNDFWNNAKTKKFNHKNVTLNWNYNHCKTSKSSKAK